MADRAATAVGFIGLGTMGARIAANLQKAGHRLVLHDVRPAAAEAHLTAGAEWADSPRAVAERCGVLFTSLPTPADVEQVALGAEGILAGARPGTALFDLSTNSRAVLLRLAEAFAERGCHLLDAPVSGGPKGAASGRLAIWVGGDEAVFAAHRPLLEAFGDQVRHIGAVGHATVAKLVHNCAGYMVQTALAEAFTVGVRAGVDPLTLWAALRQGTSGRARTFDRLADQFLPGEFDPPSFPLALANKDMGLATDLGRELGVPMRLANLTQQEMLEALARGWGHRDSRVPMLLQQERAGVELRLDPEAIRAVLDEDA